MPGAGGVRPLVLFCLLGVLLSGCLKLDATLVVGPDNTITGDYVVAYKKDPNRPDNGLGSVRELLVTRGKATASRYDDGEYLGTRYRLDGVPLEDLGKFVPVTYDRRQTGTIRITRDSNDFLVAGSFDFRDTKPTKRTLEEQRQAEDLFKVRVRLTFPGPVESGNGTIEGNTITWQMNPFVLTTLQAQASAIPPPVAAAPTSASNGAMLLAVSAGALALLVLLALGLWSLRRRGQRRGEAPIVVAEVADPSDFSWVVGDRRAPPPADPTHESWAGAPPDVRYGPGLGGPPPDPGPGYGPGLGTPVGQVSWYGSYGSPIGPASGPAPRADAPVANGYGPPAPFRPPPGSARPPGAQPPESGPPWHPAQAPPEPPPGSGPP
jgi:hypothetical protein